MPTYTILNKVTGEEYEEYFTSYSELQEFLTEHSDLTQGVSSRVNIVSGTYTSHFKTDSDFKSLLKNIKKGNKGTTFNVD